MAKKTQSKTVSNDDLYNRIKTLEEALNLPDKVVSLPVVKYINKSKFPQLERKYSTDSGYDIRVSMDVPAKLVTSGTTFIAPTEVFIELPNGYEAQVRPRSGLATQGITIINAPGTIDEEYRGELRVILTNLTNTPVQIHNGDRIAQIVFVKRDEVKLLEVKQEELSDTERGIGGFGHTGKN